MEPNKRKYQYDNGRTSYTDGSAVRKLNAVPTRREQYVPAPQPKRREQPVPQRQERVKPKELCSINLASLVVLTAAVVASFYVCYQYLQIHTSVSTLEKDIKRLESTLTKTKNENDATYALINSAYDMEYIYQVAVEELGMVYPNKNLIITYESDDIGYVRQYQDIPD